MSVESPKRSRRTSQARSTREPISSRSLRAPSSSASSKPIRDGTRPIYEADRTIRLRHQGRPQTPPAGSIPGEVLDDLGVALGARAEGDDLQSVVIRLERARDGGSDPDRVELLDLLHLVVELHSARAGDHDVDLLGALVAVGERVPLAGLHLLQRDSALFGIEVPMSEARLLDLAESLARRHVLDFPEVLDRVVHARETTRRCGDYSHPRDRSPLPLLSTRLRVEGPGMRRSGALAFVIAAI